MNRDLSHRHLAAAAAAAIVFATANTAPANEEPEGGGGQKQPFLGVQVTRPNAALAAQLGLDGGIGVVIDAVQDDSPAAAAGIKQFDVLTKLGDQILVNPEQFITLVRRKAPGENVSLTLLRRAKERQVDVTLGETTAARQMLQSAVADAFQIPSVKPEIHLPGNRGGGGIDIDVDIEKLHEGIDTEIERLLPGNLSEEIREQIKKALKDGAGASAQHPDTGGKAEDPSASSSVVVKSNTAKTIVVKTEDGTTAIITGDGESDTIRVTNRDGALLYEGPYNDDEDKARVPAAIREKLKVLDETGHHKDATTSRPEAAEEN